MKPKRPRIQKKLVAGSSDDKKSQSAYFNNKSNYAFIHLSDKEEFKTSE